jgi:hypothetical protein
VDDKELLKLYEEENRTLSERVRQLNAEGGSLANRISELEQELDTSRWEVKEANDRAGSAEDKAKATRASGAAIEKMRALPRTLADVVSVIQELFGHRIAFTDRGIRSVKGARIMDTRKAWEALHAMATDLHQLYFSGDLSAAEIGVQFRERSSFEIAMTETKETKRDKKLMALRDDTWDGQTIDITPHLKFGSSEPDMLRVHYFPDHKRKILVIGHCGGHLDTSGTRRM